jgi:hypothetical protein
MPCYHPRNFHKIAQLNYYVSSGCCSHMAVSPDDIILLITRIVIFFLIAVCAIHVTRRGMRTKSIEMMFLAAVFWSTMIYFIAMVMRTIGLVVPYAIGIAIIQASTLCLYWFVHKTFYADRKSPFKIIMPVAFVIAGILVYIGFVRDGTPIGTSAYDQIRWLHTLFSSAQFFLGGACQVIISCIEYVNLRKNSTVPPHVINRYLYFGLSAIFMILQAISDVIWTYLDLTKGYGYTIASLFNSIVSVGYAIALYMTWVMPSWLARYLDRHYSSAATSQTTSAQEIEGISPVTRKSLDKLLTSREMMAIIEYLGDILAKAIDKSPAAAKGLLLMAIEAEEQSMDVSFLRFQDLKRAITRSLKTRLEKLQVPDAVSITKMMGERLVKDQSLLVMLSL